MSKKTIGILGGGQLARMSAFAAYRMGFNVSILEKEPNSPAGMMAKNEFIGWVDDEEILKKFANSADVITLENEFIDYKKLEFLENMGKNIFPSSKTISLIQDKFIQKQTLKNNSIPVADFIEVSQSDRYENISKKLSSSFILKSRKMGYDGYGNYKINSESDFHTGVEKLQARHSSLMAERIVDFTKELAVMVARTKNESAVYPVVETIQKNHICHTVIAPAEISSKLAKDVKEIALESVKAVDGFGIFGIEFFLTSDEKILVNEMAPRPHNSGHYSIEGCITSQFENHVRAVFELPLGSTDLVNSYAVMINLLGKKNGIGVPEDYHKALEDKNAHLHIYGKQSSRPGRKMGHLTLVGNNLQELLDKADKAEYQIII